MAVLTYESFSAQLNSTFALSLGESGVELTLTEAVRQPVLPYPGMVRAPFSLILRSSSPVVLPQRIYPFKHAAIGKFDMFIVPLGREPTGVVYQAVFN